MTSLAFVAIQATVITDTRFVRGQSTTMGDANDLKLKGTFVLLGVTF